MWHTIPSREMLSTEHLGMLVEFILCTFDDANVEIILEDFEQKRPIMQIAQLSNQVKTSCRRAASYSSK